MNITTLRCIVALLFLLCNMACGNDDDTASSEKEQLKMVAGRWKATAVIHSGTSLEGYDDFALNITIANDKVIYGIEGNPSHSPWHTSGMFSLAGETTGQWIREDSVNVQYIVTATTLQLSFTYPDEAAQGRSNSLAGIWEFSFERIATGS